MRAMRHLDPQHYTPFSGLCIFTATLMNLYAVKFPAMSRPSSSSAIRGEDPETLLAENMDDLRRFSELWKMGRGLLDVVGVMRKLYDRVLSHEARRSTHSRESYAALEKTINLAQDHEIQVSELVAEASTGCVSHDELLREDESVPQQGPAAHGRQRPDGGSMHDVFGGDFTGVSDVQEISPGSLSAVLDEDVWRDFVFFQDM
jgi:hypothetical protein